MFKFPNGDNIATGNVKKATDGVYHLKVELKGNTIKYYINNTLVYDGTHDFTSGYEGLNGWNSEVNFTNIKLTSAS